MKNAGEKIASIIQNGDLQDLKINNLKLVMLYGSRARGNYNKNSDLDLAFLFSEEYLQQENSLKLRIKLAGKTRRIITVRNRCCNS